MILTYPPRIRPRGLGDVTYKEDSWRTSPDSERYSSCGTESDDDGHVGTRTDNMQTITDLVLRDPRPRTSSPDSFYSDTPSGRPEWIADDSDIEEEGGHDFLRRHPRGRVAMNYHHDHLLHQEWPSINRPPLRGGDCQVCPSKRSFGVPKLHQVEAFAAQCFYCAVILEVTKSHLGSEPLPLDSFLQWYGDSWYDFGIPCDIHKVEAADEIRDPEHGKCYLELFVPSGMSCPVTYIPGGMTTYLTCTLGIKLIT